MTIRLTVRTAVWRAHVAQLAQSVDGLVPVVKGNGYGFGRRWLAEFAAEFADTIAVGTVHELDAVPAGVEPVVLTPSLRPPPTGAPRQRSPILTVGSPAHVAALEGWRGPVLVKLASSMRRYGGGPELIAATRRAGLEVVGVSVHPPLAGTDAEHAAEVAEALVAVPADIPAWVSHLTPAACATLPADRTYRLRLGTALWHADKRALQLSADVIDTRPVAAGEQVGYRLVDTPGDGQLVMIGAGSANGVTTLADGRSPFHYRRRRLALIEAPHMHTSMAFVPAGEPAPEVGEFVDLQRPLTMTAVDEYDWR